MRLGIFGGSFDPPHLGHVLAATDALEHLSLDRIVWVPAATQPLKAGKVVGSADHRLAMVRLTVDHDERFEADEIEIERKGLSFTVETLEHFAIRYPKAERHLLVGADVLETFHQWREPKRVLELAHLAVLERQGEPARLPKELEAGVSRLPTRRIDISSTEIRDRVHRGLSLRGFVTDSVAEYIGRCGLYR